MPQLPSFDDPRYLDEVGWFLSHEKYAYEHTGRSYAADRMEWSEMFLKDLLNVCRQPPDWIRDKSVVSIGCGCSGDLAAWPAASKIAVDPLVYAYQRLDMLLPDRPGTAPTTYLSIGIEDLPLLDACADIVLCRNSLDHMLDPGAGLAEMSRILSADGSLFLLVDIGGAPTPDEPSPFTRESLMQVLAEHFEVLSLGDGNRPHSAAREYSVRVLARRRHRLPPKLDKERIREAYERSVESRSAQHRE